MLIVKNLTPLDIIAPYILQRVASRTAILMVLPMHQNLVLMLLIWHIMVDCLQMDPPNQGHTLSSL